MNVELFDDGSALLQMRRSASKDDFREVCLTAAQVKQSLLDATVCRQSRRVSRESNRCECTCCTIERAHSWRGR